MCPSGWKPIRTAVMLNSDAKVNGDCDQDGTISQADAAILMQFLVHLVDELPVQGA